MRRAVAPLPPPTLIAGTVEFVVTAAAARLACVGHVMLKESGVVCAATIVVTVVPLAAAAAMSAFVAEMLMRDGSATGIVMRMGVARPSTLTARPDDDWRLSDVTWLARPGSVAAAPPVELVVFVEFVPLPQLLVE